MRANKPKMEPAVKLDLLETSFSPGRIKLHIELTPPVGDVFDCPLREPGKKLNMVANYARTIFEVELRKPLKQTGGRKHGR